MVLKFHIYLIYQGILEYAHKHLSLINPPLTFSMVLYLSQSGILNGSHLQSVNI